MTAHRRGDLIHYSRLLLTLRFCPSLNLEVIVIPASKDFYNSAALARTRSLNQADLLPFSFPYSNALATPADPRPILPLPRQAGNATDYRLLSLTDYASRGLFSRFSVWPVWNTERPTGQHRDIQREKKQARESYEQSEDPVVEEALSKHRIFGLFGSCGLLIILPRACSLLSAVQPSYCTWDGIIPHGLT